MSLYVIADLHLSKSTEKPMDVFGPRWDNYMEKIEERWKNTVTENDTVVIAGDISWAMTNEELKPDFDFIESLPGQKIILKGNHDYWWQTASKLDAFVRENGYKTIKFLHNNAYEVEDFILIGSRGWYNDDKTTPIRGADSKKIIAREVERIKHSVACGRELMVDGENKEMIAFLHFPAIFKGYMCDEIIMELYRANISRCYFGHIHGNYESPAVIKYADIDFHLISADYILFTPEKIEPTR
ncbi:MAG: metallophosphoesterase [Clostridiales bacterium]|nr:metallophosphoesterase [Clostridiales bacterium]